MFSLFFVGIEVVSNVVLYDCMYLLLKFNFLIDVDVLVIVDVVYFFLFDYF